MSWVYPPTLCGGPGCSSVVSWRLVTTIGTPVVASSCSEHVGGLLDQLPAARRVLLVPTSEGLDDDELIAAAGLDDDDASGYYGVWHTSRGRHEAAPT